MAKKHKFSHKFHIFFVQFTYFVTISSADYTPPDKYFINCGSDSNATVSGRVFVGDVNSGKNLFSPGESSVLESTGKNSSSGTSSLYQTARVYNQNSSYEINIIENGTYFLRLHFYPTSSSITNLSSSVFDVSASGSSLLSDFSPGNGNISLEIKEFLLYIDIGKFKINFIPSIKTGLAFVNAIELFIAPNNLIQNTPLPHITTAGSDNNTDLKFRVLHPVYRINMGDRVITDDKLWRNWVLDDDYLFLKQAAKNSDYYNEIPKYGDQGSSQYTASDLVYRTAKEMNINSSLASNFFNITWNFHVKKNVTHLVRAHFCDIISPTSGTIQFYFYIFRNFNDFIDPSARVSESGVPFYNDYVVESDDSGFINISVGPQSGSVIENAFLNGLEIMELIESSVVLQDNKSNNHNRLIMIVLIVGVVGLIFVVMVVVLLLWYKCRGKKLAKDSEWRDHDPSSYTGVVNEGTVHVSSGSNLNLGLKIPFSEILFATNQFDPKLVIGEGGFGKVYKGTCRNGEKVAVKRSQPGHGQGLLEFQTEIIILSKIRHHHLVSLIGYCEEQSEMILVNEFMENGTLQDHLYGNTNSKLTWKQRLEICIGSARGLHYLHTGSAGGIIHRDVKSTNILLDQNFVAKVADFGLSKLGPLNQNETHVSTVVKGSFGYLDPEYFRCMQLTDKSDVYSFGVVLLEVLCARPAINVSLPKERINLAEWGLFWQSKRQLGKIIDPILTVEINPNSLRKYGEIVEKCLKDYGVERPTMSDVLWDLEYALQLQKTAVCKEPHEDSTTDVSMQGRDLLHAPSFSGTIDDIEDHSIVERDGSVTSASDVFSQLKIDGAR